MGFHSPVDQSAFTITRLQVRIPTPTKHNIFQIERKNCLTQLHLQMIFEIFTKQIGAGQTTIKNYLARFLIIYCTYVNREMLKVRAVQVLAVILTSKIKLFLFNEDLALAG